MPTEVLVGIDGSRGSQQAMEYAVTEFPEAAITAVAVVDPVEADYAGPAPPMLGYWGEWYRDAVERADRALEAAAAIGREHDVEVDTVRSHGSTHRTILEHVEESDVDHVVLGPHDRSDLLHAILGTTAQKVVRRSPVPVTVVR